MSRAYIQRWRRWWYQKGGCSAGKISMDCECVDWACLCMYVSRFACVFVCCCDFFSLPIRSLLRLYPFNSIIQWCTSRINGKRAHAHTHTYACTHVYTGPFIRVYDTETCTLFETFLFMLQQHLWRLLPVSAVLLLPEFYGEQKKKRNVK